MYLRFFKKLRFISFLFLEKMSFLIVSKEPKKGRKVTLKELQNAGVTDGRIESILSLQEREYIFRHKIAGNTGNKRTFKNVNIFEPNWFITIKIRDDNDNFWYTLNDRFNENNLQIKTIHSTAMNYGYKLSVVWVECFPRFQKNSIFFVYK